MLPEYHCSVSVKGVSFAIVNEEPTSQVVMHTHSVVCVIANTHDLCRLIGKKIERG